MKDQAIYHLFVYGSLRKEFNSPAYEYIRRYFSFVEEARVRGNLFDLGEFPAAVPTSADQFIVGELYVITNKMEFSWAMGQVDDYEGILVEPGEEQLYRRDLVDVYGQNSVTKAWIYWYNGNTDDKPIVASGDVIQYLEQKNNPSATSPR